MRFPVKGTNQRGCWWGIMLPLLLGVLAVNYAQISGLQRKTLIINLYLSHEEKGRVIELLGQPSSHQPPKHPTGKSKTTLHYWTDYFMSSGVSLGFDENERLVEYHYEP